MQQEFIDAVNSNDVSSVRFALSNELLLDPRGNSFDEMMQFAESKLPNLYEVDAPLSFNTDKTNWNEDFLFSVKNDLDMGFAKNKLVFYKEVAQYVMREKIDALNDEERKSREVVVQQPSTTGSQTDSFDVKKIIIVVVAIILLIVMVRSCGSSDSGSEKKQDTQKGNTQTEQKK